MRRLPTDLLNRERERARRSNVDAGATPQDGDIWTVSSSVTSTSEPHRIIEHSRAPVAVCVLRMAGALVEVAPISFDVDLLGAFDVAIDDDSLLGQSFMVESWLRMPVTRKTLFGRVGALSSDAYQRVMEQAALALRKDAPELSETDPRRAYRQDERMRVIFAMAGTGEELTIGGSDMADADALRTKRDAARWVMKPAPRENGRIRYAYEGYETDPSNTKTEQTPTTGRGSAH